MHSGSNDSANELVFITYNNTSNGRKHDPKTSRAIRQRAFTASKDGLRTPRATKPWTFSNQKTKFRLPKSSQVPATTTPSTKPPVLLQPVSPFKPIFEPLGDDAWKLLRYCMQATVPTLFRLPGHANLSRSLCLQTELPRYQCRKQLVTVYIV
jgi:hypothetical protein